MAWISGPVTGKQGEVPNSLMRKLLEKLKNTGKIPEFEGQPSIDEIMELATTGKEPPSVKRDYGLRDWEKDFIPAPPPEEATGVDVRDPDAWLEDMMEMLDPHHEFVGQDSRIFVHNIRRELAHRLYENR